MRFFYLKFLLFWTFLLRFFHFLLSSESETKQHFFYDKIGILNIDGSVAGMSEPITLDMKAQKHYCAQKQYYTFVFCPDADALAKRQFCDEGIAFCYEPILTEQLAVNKFVLQTMPDLEVSKKCGESFRGFKVVALRRMYNLKGKLRYFYEFELAFVEEPFYFEMPEDNCIQLLLGNPINLETFVQTINNEPLEPVQIRKSFNDSSPFGIDTETFLMDLPEAEGNARFMDQPNLKMLYMDMKSREFTPQMMFTVGPSESCNLFARVRSNKVGSCKSGFRQKTIALRSYGNGATTSYTLTLASGVDTNDTKGTKKLQQRILDQEFEEMSEQADEDIQTDPTIQSYKEDVKDTKTQVLDKSEKNSKSEKDVTPIELKLAEAAVNTAAALACGGLAFITLGFVSCEGKAEFKDIETTTFHESFTKTKITNEKTVQSSASTHSVQTTAFSHSRGKTDTTTHSEEKSLSNAVSTRTVFQWEIEVPQGKVLTPMQMSVDCDGNNVKIPWMKFRLTDEADDLIEDYDDDKDKKKGKDPRDKLQEDADELEEMVKEVSEQELAAQRAFERPKPVSPITKPASEENEEDDDYFADLITGEEQQKPKPKAQQPKQEDEVDNAEEDDDDYIKEVMGL